MSKILLADSGSTKTDWCLIDTERGLIERFNTVGINPFQQTEAEISTNVRDSLIPSLGDVSIDKIFFYGAGCANEEKKNVVRCALAENISADIAVDSDLMGAARALCGTEIGIACILGTGSNSCQYDGKKIVHNVSPLGYVLGDEGGGDCLGKTFLGNVLKRQFSVEVCERFFAETGVTQAEILDNVYKKPFPNRYLASFSPIILSMTKYSEVRGMVIECFDSFFNRNVMKYEYQKYSANFVGSIAYHFDSLLKESAAKWGITVGTIIKSPMDGLIGYHLRHN
jgi:N-acetylglucosamine kinase-like BadF-type ATPase